MTRTENATALDSARQAFAHGYKMAQRGALREACPYKGALCVAAWIRGFEEYEKQKKENEK